MSSAGPSAQLRRAAEARSLAQTYYVKVIDVWYVYMLVALRVLAVLLVADARPVLSLVSERFGGTPWVSEQLQHLSVPRSEQIRRKHRRAAPNTSEQVPRCSANKVPRCSRPLDINMFRGFGDGKRSGRCRGRSERFRAYPRVPGIGHPNTPEASGSAWIWGLIFLSKGLGLHSGRQLYHSEERVSLGKGCPAESVERLRCLSSLVKRIPH